MLGKIVKHEILKTYLEVDQNPDYPSVRLTEIPVRVESFPNAHGYVLQHTQSHSMKVRCCSIGVTAHVLPVTGGLIDKHL